MLQPGDVLGTDRGPTCSTCQGRVYSYKLVKYPKEEGRSEEWYADWRCRSCGKGGALYVGMGAPVSVAEVRRVHENLRGEA